MKSSDKRLLFRAALNLFAPYLLETVSDEHRFFKPRRWRFDFAWPARMVAVEIDGGRWAPGGGWHAGDEDREKLSAAAALGWRVLRFSTQQVEKHPQECVELTLCALDNMGLLPGWIEKPPGRRQ